MKRGHKDIEHENYSAPTQSRRKVDGHWVYETLAPHVRKFVQRERIRVAATSIAKRYAPHLFDAFKTYVDHDRIVTQLTIQGEKSPSNMAKKKFYAHRPKPADNRIKNAMRRWAQRAWQVAKEPPMRSKGSPGIPMINSAQLRIVAAQTGRLAYRRMCGDRNSGRRNSNWSGSASGSGARECARRRRQMGIEHG